jgi:CBS domain-containing protein
MEKTVREVMTSDPRTVQSNDTVLDAASLMRAEGFGVAIVLDNGNIRGLLTDRDIVVRAVAAGRDPSQTKVADVASEEISTVTPDQELSEVVRLMGDKHVRRLPVVEDGKPVGIVSMGDLTIERDLSWALADISAAPPNE